MSETHTVIVRERTPADVPAAAAALVEVHNTDGYPVEGVADPAAWLTTTGQIAAWVAELDGHVIGHVAVNEPQPADAAARIWADDARNDGRDVGILGRLFVLPSARGHAAGRRLVETASAAAQKRRLRLVLDVMTKDGAAIALYERLDWQSIGTTKHPDGHGHAIPAICYVSPP